MMLLTGAGPLFAVLLAGALATRALMIAGGPDIKTGTRGLTILIVVLAALTAVSMALRLLGGV
jgi:hypothetical protein